MVKRKIASIGTRLADSFCLDGRNDDDRKAARQIHEMRVKELCEFYAGQQLFTDAPSGDPTTKPVYCVSVGRWFSTGREAADFLSQKTGKIVQRKDIRGAIVRKGKVAGYIFSYVGPEKNKPKPTNLSSIGVVCRETREPFQNITAAAQSLSVGVARFRESIRTGEAVNGRHYDLAHQLQKCA